MTQDDKDRLKAIEARHRHASFGPWRTDGGWRIVNDKNDTVCYTDTDSVRANRNEDFVANSWDDVRFLLGVIGGLEEELDEVKAADCDECMSRESDPDRDEMEARIARYEDALKRIVESDPGPAYHIARSALNLD